MKKHTTYSSFLNFTYLRLIILAGILAFNNVCVKALISQVGISNIKLTTATLTVTITPNGSAVDNWGVKWSITSGSYNHSIDVVGSTPGGLLTVEMPELDRSKTIYYQVYSKEGTNTEYSTESSFSNVPVFTGTGNWDEVSRWNVGEVPGVVPGDSPIIDGICTIANNSSNGSWLCDNLTIQPGRKLTVNPAQALNVSGVLTNNAEVAGLVIKSDGIKANGTLIFNNDQLHPVLATVEMYSKASWDLNQDSGSKYSWQYFGIPVKTISFGNSTFGNCMVRKYNEASTTDLDLWTALSTAMSLTTGTGYEIVQPNAKVYVFTGELNNDNFIKTLDYNPGARFPGQHIFSNPYTAAIDIKTISYDGNPNPSIYLYNTGTYNDWFKNSATTSTGSTTAPGQYVVSTPGSVGVLGVPAQIPSMQGFLIVNSQPTNGSITIPYMGSTINNTELQRAQGLKEEINSDKIATRIDVYGTHSADCMWIFTDPTCTGNFDKGWDGYKMQGSILTPQLYAMEAAGDLQIDAVADVNGTFLGFSAGQDTDYKLTFTHQNTQKRYSGLYLVDLLENKTTDITASGSEYSFTAQSSANPVKRFKIITNSEVATNNPVTSSLFKIFNSNGTLVIQNNTNQDGNLVIYTMNGVTVEIMAYKANGITTFSTARLLPGAYIAKAGSDKERVTERIIIR
jgi:hypothetical protein